MPTLIQRSDSVCIYVHGAVVCLVEAGGGHGEEQNCGQHGQPQQNGQRVAKHQGQLVGVDKNA